MIAGNVGDPPYAVDSNGDGGALVRRDDRFTGVGVGNEAAVRRRVNYRADSLHGSRGGGSENAHGVGGHQRNRKKGKWGRGKGRGWSGRNAVSRVRTVEGRGSRRGCSEIARMSGNSGDR